MELVLSPGRLGGGDANAPFQNQEVREWSHVDRLTGMLEHARVETGRWQARRHGSAQAYGKVIDSRERNSADGNVVQKARRQVEVFQSQGVGGRSVQVVRASQWSSSRITDSSSSSPVSVSMSEGHLKNGSDDATETRSTRLSSDESSLTKLSQVSRLCRQIHAEAVNKQTSLPTKTLLDPFSRRESEVESKSSSSLSHVRSTSNEDLATCVDVVASPRIFRRDCRARRSLQIPKSTTTTKTRPDRTEDVDTTGNVVSSNLDSRRLGGRYTVTELETSLYRRSPPSNFEPEVNDGESIREGTIVTSESPLQDSSSVNITSVDKFTDSSEFPKSRFDDSMVKNEVQYPRPVPISLNPKTKQSSLPKVNTTVVHLNNVLFPPIEPKEEENEPSIRPASTVQCRINSLVEDISRSKFHKLPIEFAKWNHPRGNTEHFLPGTRQQRMQNGIEEFERVESTPTTINGESELLVLTPERKSSLNGDDVFGRPTKKVGFSKTEIHFAAESGKVNIVETDCKPPPSNRFRRRRKQTAATMSTGNENLPLIHFGDTSYEKYIFGQNATIETDKLTPNGNTKGLLGRRDEDFVDKCTLDELKGGWGVKLKTILRTEPPTRNDEETDLDVAYDDSENAIVDHAFRGHTTTVNLGANVPMKIDRTREGKRNTISTRIYPWLDKRAEALLRVASFDNVTDSRSIRPTNDPAIGISSMVRSKIPRPLTHVQHSVLRSAHLVMNLNRINDTDKASVHVERNSSKSLVSSITDSNRIVVPACERTSNDYSTNITTTTLITINASSNEKMSNECAYQNRVNDDLVARPPRMLPMIASRGRVTREEEQNHVQYSSGSEQADEEVRSYMLGSRVSRDQFQQNRTVEKILTIRNWEDEIDVTLNEAKDNDNFISRVVNRGEEGLKTGWKWKYIKNHKVDNVSSLIDNDSDFMHSELSVDEECVEMNETRSRDAGEPHVSATTQRSVVISSDNENNKVLLNVVKTHGSVVARVEDKNVSRERGKSRPGTHLDLKLKSGSEITECYYESGKKSEVAKELKVKDPLVSKRSGTKVDKCQESKNAKRTSNDNERKAKEVSCDKVSPCVNNKVRSSSSTSASVENEENATNATDPTYVNVFVNPKDVVAPIYENCGVIGRDRRIKGKKYANIGSVGNAALAELNSVTENILEATATSNARCATESSVNNTEDEDSAKSRDKSKTLATISENRKQRDIRHRQEHKSKQLIRTRNRKASGSSASSVESLHQTATFRSPINEKDKKPKSPRTETTRSSSNRSNDETSDNRGDANLRKSRDESNSSNSKRDKSETIERRTKSKTTRSSRATDHATKKSNDSVRSKKPIEIVYQTAVFNMKNEKLSKPSKTGKESKTPRYINDLICGSKYKRSSDIKHVKGTALSQQRANKSTSPTTRHWK